MSASLPSDEVAEDYKYALEDLVTNDRYQINNLTMIAKENIEHAEAISRVLVNHIKRASPSRKLPALYVLDSLVKNIQSPYTIYLARDLHSTFMLAYSQVDPSIRRKFEETLKTWREPVPGSLSTNPVFPFQSTQSIIDALNRHRASATPVPGRPIQLTATSNRPLAQPYHNTATPPQSQAALLPNYSHAQASGLQALNRPSGLGQHYTPASIPQVSIPSQAQLQPHASSSVDVTKLHADIDDLTTDAKIECATHPMDSNAQQKLTTLQTLKEILDAGTASDQDLKEISTTIAQQMAKKLAMKSQSTIHAPVPPDQTYGGRQSQAPYQNGASPPTNSLPSLSFLNSTSLSELLRATASVQPVTGQAGSFPSSYASQFQSLFPPSVAPSDPVAAATENTQTVLPPSAVGLLEQLRASGLLSATSLPSKAITPPSSFAHLLSGPSVDVPLTSIGVRTPRPHLINKFLEERPNQCSTCGRRFTADEYGRERKARHLDWHFKTKARMIEAEVRGQNRSWYVDERDWISNKEFDDDLPVTDDNVGPQGASSNTATKQKVDDFVRAPTDPLLRNAPCPIDQEPFKSEWSEEVQDFIWKDAIQVGNRYYHASCYKEATRDWGKDGGSTPIGAGMTRTATPESVLGKRKAQQEAEASAKSRIKFEA